jgi:hypothetical protein
MLLQFLVDRRSDIARVRSMDLLAADCKIELPGSG